MMYEYFVLKQDLYYRTGIQAPIRSYYEYSKKVQQGDYTGLEIPEVIVVEPGEFNLYPEILSRQVFMVKQSILDVILLFNKNMKYSMKYVMDRKYKKMHPYFIPFLQTVDCLSTKAEIASGGKLSKAVLNAKKIQKETHIFQLDKLQKNTIVVSTALLEAILRRKPEMITFTRVEMSEV